MYRRSHFTKPSAASAFLYDDHGKLTRLDLRNGAYSTYAYDRGSRLTRLVNNHSPYADTGAGVTRYLSASFDYEYDANANITAIEQEFNGVPIRTEYAYDALNRLTKETTCEYMDSYYFSGAGDRATMIRKLGYSYTQGGTKVFVNANAEQCTRAATKSYSFNAAHELTKMVSNAWDGANVTRTYAYDQAGRLTAQTKTDTGAATVAWAYEWDALDRLTKGQKVTAGSPNVTKTIYFGYNAAGLRAKRVDGAGAVTKLHSYQGNNIASIQQEFNGVPIRTDYAYDPLNRLTKETTCEYMDKYYLSPAGDRTKMISYEGYTYTQASTKYFVNADSSTRIVTKTYTFNSAHELTQMLSNAWDGANVTRTYGFDYAGRLTAQTKTDSGAATVAWSYEWDALDRLTKAQKVTSGSPNVTKTVNFAYNAAGLRVRRIDTGTNVTKLYSYQGNNIASIQESSGGSFGSKDWVYTVAPGMISNALERHQPNYTGNSTQSQFYQYDHRGNVAVVTDGNGSVKYGYQYDAFGNLASSFELGQSSAPTDDILFTGKDWDPDLELYYFNARWYDPETGRFVSVTHNLSVHEEHRYVYCEGNPMKRLDVSGRTSIGIDFYILGGLSFDIGWSLELYCACREAGGGKWECFKRAWFLKVDIGAGLDVGIDFQPFHAPPYDNPREGGMKIGPWGEWSALVIGHGSGRVYTPGQAMMPGRPRGTDIGGWQLGLGLGGHKGGTAYFW